MTNTAIAAIEQPRTPTIIDKPRRLEIRGKRRAALDAMVWQGLPWDDAARAVNYTVASMRKALQETHVLAYLRAQREVLRQSVCAANIHRAREIRDAANNMPAVQAMRYLDQLPDGIAQSGSTMRAPGVVVVIQQVSAHPTETPPMMTIEGVVSD